MLQAKAPYKVTIGATWEDSKIELNGKLLPGVAGVAVLMGSAEDTMSLKDDGIIRVLVKLHPQAVDVARDPAALMAGYVWTGDDDDETHKVGETQPQAEEATPLDAAPRQADCGGHSQRS